MSHHTVPSAEIAVKGGLEDPVFDAQAIFAAVLRAFAHPGEIVDLGARCTPPPPLSPAQGAILATLSDGDTPVFVEGAKEPLRAWLAFQTGASLEETSVARFAVARSVSPRLLEALPLGTLEYPDRSATLIVEVAGFTAGRRYLLEGPGVDGTRALAIAGLGKDFVAARRINHSLYPCGIDLLLTCGTQAVALPRSTIVREG